MERIVAPVEQEERIQELDILRGVALLGILIANMPLFSSPYLYIQMLDKPWWTQSIDPFALWFIYAAVETKFLSMFSLLFGISFAIFMERASRKNRNAFALYTRRLSVLLAFGMIHSYFIWYGDILLLYAILGFLLLLFHKCRPNTLLIWAISLLIIPAAWIAVHTFAPQILPFGLPLGPAQAEIERQVQSSLTHYGSGTYADMFHQRLTDLANLQNGTLPAAPLSLAMFLLGAYAWKKGWSHWQAANQAWIRTIWPVSGAVGLIFLALQIWLRETADRQHAGFLEAHFAGVLIAGPALSLFYATSVLILLQKPRFRKWITPFRHAGQMALTNYLMQSIICTLLFYRFGLGMYGQVRPAYGLMLSVLIFAFQAGASAWWLKRYRFGPVEWLWRTLTYGSIQPMKRRNH